MAQTTLQLVIQILLIVFLAYAIYLLVSTQIASSDTGSDSTDDGTTVVVVDDSGVGYSPWWRGTRLVDGYYNDSYWNSYLWPFSYYNYYTYQPRAPGSWTGRRTNWSSGRSWSGRSWSGGRPSGGRPSGGRPSGGRPSGGRPSGGRPSGGRR